MSRRTGLSPELIRAWERRHRVIQPARTGGNRRLYSDRDVNRLILVRNAVEAGWHIGHVASLRNAQLQALLDRPRADGPAEDLAAGASSRTASELVSRCLEAAARLDGEMLAAQLDEAAVAHGRIEMIDGVLVPLFERVGEGCASGALRIASEHLASAVAARFLESLQGARPAGETAPAIVVTTPAFQEHHLGALLVAATARMEGWRTAYLGPNLPAEEIAAAARIRRAKAVALSVTHPSDRASLDGELRRLARLLRGTSQLVVGGRAARDYQAVLDAIGARRLDDLASLRDYLRAGT